MARAKSKKKRSRPVIIDGTLYPSIAEAAQACGLLPNTLHARIGTAKWPGYRYADLEAALSILVTVE